MLEENAVRQRRVGSRCAGSVVRVFVVLAFAVALVGGRTVAQSHTEGHLFVGGPLNPIGLGVVGPTGRISTLFPASALGAMGIGRATMDVDNQGVAATFSLPSGIGVVLVDRGGQASTITMFPTPFGRLAPPPDVDIGPTGDVEVLAPAAAGPPGLFTIDRAGAMTTILQSSAFANPVSFIRDVDSGDFVVWDVGNLFSPPRLLRIAADGSSLAATNVVTTVSYGRAYEIAQDRRSGELYFGTGFALLRADVLGRVSSLWPGVPFSRLMSLAADRASDASPRLIGAFGSRESWLMAHDVRTGAVTTLASDPNLSNVFSVTPYRGRNVATIERAPRLWEVSLSFPAEPSKAFVCGVGISGARPGVAVGNRRILLNPDEATRLGVTGGLGPILRGAAGVLDGNGRATAFLDLRRFPALGGLRIHLVALVLDPSAPFGVSTIADPVLVIA